MKRKGLQVLFPVIAGAMVFAACASAPQQSSAPKGVGEGSGGPAPQQAKPIERIIVDYKGAPLGSEVPDWVEAAQDNDYDRISKLSRFKGKIPIVDYGSGQNLDLLRSWVNGFNVQASFSRRLNTTVNNEFGGALTGDKNTPANQQFQQDVAGTVSNTTFHGLAQEMDYWIKLRTIDHSKGTETEQYTYYVVYSIGEQELNEQLAQAMGKVPAKTQEQTEMKADIEAAIKRAAFNNIQSAE